MRTNVDLDNKFMVFDLQDLTGNLKAIGMFVVMDFLWAKIKEDRTERKAIMIDEAWQLIGASTDKRVADFVYRIFKVVRGFGGSAILATQDVSDLFSYQEGKFGKAILSNSKTKIILQLEQGEAETIQKALDLTKREVRDIINFNRGEALVCANNNKVPISIRASRMEHELITTDPAQLKEIVERRRQEMTPATAAPSSSVYVDENGRLQNPDQVKPKEEVITETGYDKKEADRLQKEEQHYYSEQAKLLGQAMDQLSENSILRNPDGSIDPFKPDIELVPTDDFDEAAQLESRESGQQRDCEENIHPLYSGGIDVDLDNAEDDTDSSEPIIQNGNERRIQYEQHPPAGF